MTQAVKKVEVENVISDEINVSVNSQKSDEVKKQETTILHLQKTKSFNRFLEAYSDCV